MYIQLIGQQSTPCIIYRFIETPKINRNKTNDIFDVKHVLKHNKYRYLVPDF